MEAEIKALVKCLAEIIQTYELLNANKKYDKVPKSKKDTN
jgi:hypothetical protein